MTQSEAIEQINVRGVYRHATTKVLYCVAGIGEHARTKLENGEKEWNVILTRKVNNDSDADIIIVPVLVFTSPLPDGNPRFEEIT